MMTTACLSSTSVNVTSASAVTPTVFATRSPNARETASPGYISPATNTRPFPVTSGGGSSGNAATMPPARSILLLSSSSAGTCSRESFRTSPLLPPSTDELSPNDAVMSDRPRRMTTQAVDPSKSRRTNSPSAAFSSTSVSLNAAAIFSLSVLRSFSVRVSSCRTGPASCSTFSNLSLRVSATNWLTRAPAAPCPSITASTSPWPARETASVLS
mmetsp:Transcript_39822/g.125091  ORF Transcript_39822/g.125091 Transcript_39822/m.125091 type:complete len:214 (-) Transcript_39822:640-1281(-)